MQKLHFIKIKANIFNIKYPLFISKNLTFFYIIKGIASNNLQFVKKDPFSTVIKQIVKFMIFKI